MKTFNRFCLIFSLLMLCVQFGCNSGANSVSNSSYDYSKLKKSRELTMEDACGHFRFIALDDDSLRACIPDVWNVKFTKDYIFVLSANDGVFQFNAEGNFIRKISSKGNGPGEWILLVDVAADESAKRIFLYDYAGKLMEFSTEDGEYIRKYDVAGRTFSKIHISGNNYIEAPFNALGNKEAMVYCADLDGGEGETKSAGQLPRFVLSDYNSMIYSFTKGVVEYDGRILLHPNLGNIIYEYSTTENMLTERLQINFEEPHTPLHFEKGLQGIKESQSLMDFAENSRYFFVKICDYTTAGKWYALDKTNGSTYQLNLTYTPELDLQFTPRYQCGEILGDIIYPNTFEEDSPQLQYMSKKSGKNITPSSNPVIVLW